MKRLSTYALSMTAMLVLPALALAQEHAAGGHEEVGAFPTMKQGLYSAVTSLVVFGLVFAVLAAKVWPTITRALDERANKIKGEIDAAEAARAQAKAALAQYEKNLADARAESQRMLDETKTHQAAMAADLRAKADAELTALREKAKKDIETAKRSAIAEIHDHATTLASSIAGKILQREVNAQDQQRLLQDSLNELQHVSRN